MRRQTLGGWCMIVGAVMGLVTMALHPTGRDVARNISGQGALNLAVHAFALASVPIAFFGALVLTRRLAALSDIAELALVFYGAAAMASMMAATASGFLATGLIEGAMTLAGEARTATQVVLHYNGGLNQAFAKILVAASSVAIGLWSVAILRTGLMRRGAGVLGCIVAAVTLLVLFSGRLVLDVHGFGAVVLGQGVWLVAVGMELLQATGERRLGKSLHPSRLTV